MKRCPKCKNLISYNYHFGGYICDVCCEWEDISRNNLNEKQKEDVNILHSDTTKVIGAILIGLGAVLFFIGFLIGKLF